MILITAYLFCFFFRQNITPCHFEVDRIKALAIAVHRDPHTPSFALLFGHIGMVLSFCQLDCLNSFISLLKHLWLMVILHMVLLNWERTTVTDSLKFIIQ